LTRSFAPPGLLLRPSPFNKYVLLRAAAAVLQSPLPLAVAGAGLGARATRCIGLVLALNKISTAALPRLAVFLFVLLCCFLGHGGDDGRIINIDVIA
jgi:hypothetical protein